MLLCGRGSRDIRLDLRSTSYGTAELFSTASGRFNLAQGVEDPGHLALGSGDRGGRQVRMEFPNGAATIEAQCFWRSELLAVEFEDRADEGVGRNPATAPAAPEPVAQSELMESISESMDAIFVILASKRISFSAGSDSCFEADNEATKRFSNEAKDICN